jgi:uncharacterized membrane-anchored protein
MRKLLAIGAGVLFLAVLNGVIYSREQLLASGRVVLLELAPVDPRSLMQGDYMALRFGTADIISREKGLADGRLIVRLDERGVGQFVRRDNGEPLAEREVAMRYRVRDGQVKFASNAFFFQEGRAADFQSARYGEFRVARSGDSLLTGLRGRNLEPLGMRQR